MPRLRLALLMHLSALGLVAAGPVATVVFGLSGQAEASGVIDISQVGGNVVATGSGTVDLSGLTYNTTFSQEEGVNPSFGAVIIGPGGDIDVYTGISGPASFGPGVITYASSGSGDALGVSEGEAALAVPAGYVSGTSLSGSSTFDSATLASLGLTPGKYVYTWGSGPDADSLTVDIGSVPEPSTWAMMLLGFAGIAFVGYRKTRRAVSIAA
jgi:hypothetical protein